MKSISDIINENTYCKRIINEGNVYSETITAEPENLSKKYKYGFMQYSEAYGTIELIAFNSLKDYAKEIGVDIEDLPALDKLKVYETDVDAFVVHTRIW